MDPARAPRFVRQGRGQRASEAPGGHAVRVVAVRRQPPDLDRFVAALLALAVDRLDEEREAADAEQSFGR